MQKRAVFYVCVIFGEQSGQAGVENGAMLATFIQIYLRMHNFVVKFFFASGGKGALTKILRTFLVLDGMRCCLTR